MILIFNLIFLLYFNYKLPWMAFLQRRMRSKCFEQIYNIVNKY